MGRGPSAAPTRLDHEVSAVIRTEADLRGLSGRAVARQAGLTITRAAALLRGSVSWTLPELERTCDSLGLRVSTVVAQAEARAADAAALVLPLVDRRRHVAPPDEDAARAADEGYVAGEDTEVDGGA